MNKSCTQFLKIGVPEEYSEVPANSTRLNTNCKLKVIFSKVFRRSPYLTPLNVGIYQAEGILPKIIFEIIT